MTFRLGTHVIEDRMKGRQFISEPTLAMTAMSSFGFVRFKGEKYPGDCATTSASLGPFYRLESPIHSYLNFPGEKGFKVFMKFENTSTESLKFNID